MESTEDAGRILEYVREVISSAKEQRITGSQLNTLLRYKFPAFSAESFGCRTLRDLIRRFAPDVAEGGKSGADVIYVLNQRQRPAAPDDLSSTPVPVLPVTGAVEQEPSARSAGEEPPTAQAPFRVRAVVWRAYTNPNSRLKLFARPETGELYVTKPGESDLGSPWLLIQPCSSETHLRIAREFAATRPTPQKDSLEKTIAGTLWWRQFYAAVGELNLVREWSAYRTRGIIRELETSLQRCGIRPNRIPRATGAAPTRPKSQVGIHNLDHDQLLRLLAARTLEQMSIEELRGIRVSLGYVVDVLRRG